MGDERKKESKEKMAYFPISDLPSGVMSNIFSFFTPQELAPMARVSKSFLSLANEPGISIHDLDSQCIDFRPGSKQKLSTLLESKNLGRDLRPFESMALKSGAQITAHQKTLFLAIRREILAGRLSLRQVLAQLAELSDLSKDLFSSKLPLAKLWLKHLQPWQKEALSQGFMLQELYSDWLSPLHVAQIKAGRPLESIKGLKEYQVLGLVKGFSQGQVRAAWFTPVHAEAMQTVYANVIANPNVIANTSAEEVLRRILRADLTQALSAKQWRELISRSTRVEGLEHSQIYLAVACDCTEILAMMRQLGAYNAKDWLKLLIPETGPSPFLLAVGQGRSKVLAMLLPSLREFGGNLAENWRTLIESPLLWGANQGETAIYAAITSANPTTLQLLRETAEYSDQVWRYQLERPLTAGKFSGHTPVFMLAALGKDRAFSLLQQTGRYTEAEWRRQMEKPLAAGTARGLTPIFIAAANGRVAVLKIIKEQGAYSGEEFLALITAPLKFGSMAGQSPLLVAYKNGDAEVLSALQNACACTDGVWQGLITELSRPARSREQGDESTTCLVM